MPDVKEVYDLVTRQAPPQPDAFERQRARQKRHTMKRKVAGFAAAAAIIALALLAVRAWMGDGRHHRPATSGTTVPTSTPSTATARWFAPPGAPPVKTAPWVGTTATPEVDYVIDVNTGETTQLPRAIVHSLAPALVGGRYAASPDGSTLAYVGTGKDGSRQIFVAGIDGTSVRQLTHDPRGAESPDWSPDGTLIAYAGYGSGVTRNLFVIDVATGESRQVTHTSTDPIEVQFTPDGSSLLYTGGGIDEAPVLRTVPVAGGRSTILFPLHGGLEDTGNGSLSPDGSLVTFLGGGFPTSGGVEHCGPCRWVASADGRGLRILSGWMATPAGTWSPDGSRIVVMDGGDNLRSVIMVVDVGTEAATIVANGKAAIWLDDDTLLVQVPAGQQ